MLRNSKKTSRPERESNSILTPRPNARQRSKPTDKEPSPPTSIAGGISLTIPEELRHSIQEEALAQSRDEGILPYETSTVAVEPKHWLSPFFDAIKRQSLFEQLYAKRWLIDGAEEEPSQENLTRFFRQAAALELIKRDIDFDNIQTVLETAESHLTEASSEEDKLQRLSEAADEVWEEQKPSTIYSLLDDAARNWARAHPTLREGATPRSEHFSYFDQNIQQTLLQATTQLIEHLRSELDTYGSILDNFQQNPPSQELKARVDELTEQNKQFLADNADLEQELTKLAGETTDLEEEKKRLIEDRQVLNCNYGDLLAENEELHRQLAQKQSTPSSATSQKEQKLEWLKNKYRDQLTITTDLKEENTTLTKEVAHLAQQVSSLRQEVANKTKARDAALESISEERIDQHRIHQLEEQLAQAQSQAEAAETRAREADRRASKQKVEEEVTRAQLNRLRQGMSEPEKRTPDQKQPGGQNAQKEKTFRRLRNQIAHLNKELRRQKTKNKRQEDFIKSYSIQLNGMRRTIDLLHDSFQRITTGAFVAGQSQQMIQISNGFYRLNEEFRIAQRFYEQQQQDSARQVEELGLTIQRQQLVIDNTTYRLSAISGHATALNDLFKDLVGRESITPNEFRHLRAQVMELAGRIEDYIDHETLVNTAAPLRQSATTPAAGSGEATETIPSSREARSQRGSSYGGGITFFEDRSDFEVLCQRFDRISFDESNEDSTSQRPASTPPGY